MLDTSPLYVTLIVTAVTFVATFWVMVCIATLVAISKAEHARFTRIDDDGSRVLLAELFAQDLVNEAWLRKLEFEPEGDYQSNAARHPRMVVWQAANHLVQFRIHTFDKHIPYCELATSITKGFLRTSSSRATAAFPLPEH